MGGGIAVLLFGLPLGVPSPAVRIDPLLGLQEHGSVPISTSTPNLIGSSPIPLAPPAVDDYARQAVADPHSTPPVLRAFATRMAARMQSGLASESRAVALFAELKSCVVGALTVVSVRAVCAVNAGRLAQAFPYRLAEEYAALRGGLTREVLQSVEASGY